MGQREKRILTGRAAFADDLEMPDMAHLVFVGSNQAHARITDIQVEEACQTPGVLTVITGPSLPGLMSPLPPNSDLSGAGWKWRSPVVYPLAHDRVRFFGEPVAAVVAESEKAALRAAEKIKVHYEPLPVVTDVIKALDADSPLLYQGWGDNIQAQKLHKFGDPDEAFNEADGILPVYLREGRASGFPIEAQGCICYFEKLTGRLISWGGYQCPFRARQVMSQVFDLPEEMVQITACDIGGAFGNKIQCWKHTVVALAARIVNRPVKWFESQREFFATGPHQRDVIFEGEAAFKNNGLILGLRLKFIQDLGVEISNRSFAAASLIAACCAIPNAYKLKGLEVEAFGVVTNKAAYGAYRGYGKDKGIRLMERVMDQVGRKLDIPPEEIRFRNFIQPREFPYRQITNYVYDSGNYPAVLRAVIDKGNLSKWRQKQQNMRDEGRYIGIGLCFIVEPAGVAVASSRSGLTQARLRLTPDGRMEVYSDRTDIGQGADTSHALAVARIIGIKEESITVHPVSGDLAGMGPVSSRGSVYPLSAVAKAAKIMRSKLAKLAAVFLEASEQDVVMAAGDIYARNNPEIQLSFGELAQKIYFHPGPRALPEEMLLEGDFLPDVTTTWFSPNTAKNKMSTYTTFCASADLAAVEVDIETGQVKILQYAHAHDAGVVLSQALVDGQVHGGIAQGIGEALSEELVYSPDGKLLSGSYVDYVFPICPDVPDIEVCHLETPSPFTELGTKGMGEAPIISGKAVILSAVEDALTPMKIHIRQTPLTGENIRKLVLAAIQTNSI